MTEIKLEKWQKALNHWDKWLGSIKDTRSLVEEKYGDLEDLLMTGYLEVVTEGKDNSITAINIEADEKGRAIWALYDEVEDIGGKFISHEIGLKSNSELHQLFLAYWVHLVIPELTEDYGQDNLEDYLEDLKARLNLVI